MYIGICDDQYLFEWVSVKAVGSSHDSLAFGSTQLYAKLEKGLLDFRRVDDPALSNIPAEEKIFFLFGDDAYVASASIVTPWSGMRGDISQQSSDPVARSKAAFNYYLSKIRARIEQTFDLPI